tara:strand:+ start:221 stop:406 length:186 start_codon:yes stop_codon:yes gene_type:complete
MENLPEYVDITPNWQGLFRFAVQLVKSNVAKGDGQALIIEMLEYGARLDEHIKEDKHVLKF